MEMKPPLPQEHGAWAMLYAPLLIAVLVIGQFALTAFLFLLATTAIFLAHEPLSILVKLNPKRPSSPQIFRASKIWLAIYLALALAATAPLLFIYQRWLLLPFGVALVVLLATHIYLAAKREERSVGGEFLGVISLTLTAPGAYYVVTGRLDQISWWLWLLNIVYFTSSIFYVKMRVSRFAKKSSAQKMTWQCSIYHSFLALTLALCWWQGWLTAFVALAFLPIVLRSFVGLKPQTGKLNLKLIGLAESIYTLIFVIFLTLGLQQNAIS